MQGGMPKRERMMKNCVIQLMVKLGRNLMIYFHISKPILVIFALDFRPMDLTLLEWQVVIIAHGKYY
jgi:hypothetical protein